MDEVFLRDGELFVKLIEECGAFVCCDRFCFGSYPGRTEIILNEIAGSYEGGHGAEK